MINSEMEEKLRLYGIHVDRGEPRQKAEGVDNDDEPPPGADYDEWVEGQQEAGDPLEMIDASSFADVPMPKRDYLDERHFFRMGYLTMITGAGGAGKTLLMLQLAAACVTGSRWLSKAVKQGPVIFYSAEEDHEEIHMRLGEICTAEGIPLLGLSGLKIVDVTLVDPFLMVTSKQDRSRLDATDMFYGLERAIEELQPVLVIIDNRGQVIRGNEIDRNVASQAINVIQRLSRRFKCAIAMLAHPSLTGLNRSTGSSGSTGWINTGRGQVDMVKTAVADKDDDEGPDDGRRTLINRKGNYVQTGQRVNIVWRAGRYAVENDGEERETEQPKRDEKAEAVFMKLLIECNRQGNWVSPKIASQNYAPKVFNGHIMGEGIGKRRFEHAMQSLFLRASIETLEYGRKDRPLMRITATGKS